MSGASPDPENMMSPEANPDDIELNRGDFNRAFRDVLATIKPYLDEAICKPFGIESVNFLTGFDDSFDYEGSYSKATARIARIEGSNDKPELFYQLSPGAMDIVRIIKAFDDVKSEHDGSVHFLTDSVAHEMYASGVIVRTYIQAALEESLPDEGEYLPKLEKSSKDLDSLISSSYGLIKAMVEEDTDLSRAMLELLIVDIVPPVDIERIQMHRLAAGLYLHHHRSAEIPLQDAVLKAMKSDLASQLNLAMTDQETVFGAANPTESARFDDDYARHISEDPDERGESIIKHDDQLRVLSERIDPAVIGWAFPAGEDEINEILEKLNQP